MPVKADLDKLDEEIDNQSRLLGWEHTLLVKALSLCRLRRCIQARIKLCCSVGETLKISKRIKKHKCCHHVSTQFSLNLTWNTYSHHTRYQIESRGDADSRGPWGRLIKGCGKQIWMYLPRAPAPKEHLYMDLYSCWGNRNTVA
jgi:hypothetical protein